VATDRILTSPSGLSPDAATKRRLSEVLVPGRRRLTSSGALTTVAAAATAAGFFAVAAVAQNVLEGHASWADNAVWLLVLAGAAALRAGASYVAARFAADGALAVERQLLRGCSTVCSWAPARRSAAQRRRRR
jgi:ABC-type transport system involved in cytochrome bd biosynthesis fused ATPase/permease subunit